MTATPSSAQWAMIDAAVAEQRQIEAIRLYREATGVALAVAIRALQDRASAASQHPQRLTAAAFDLLLQRYFDSGYARPGELWARWQNSTGDCCVLVQIQVVPEPRFELGVFAPGLAHWGHQLNGATLDLAQLRAALAGDGPAGADWRESPATAELLRRRLLDLTDTAPLRHSRTDGFAAHTALIALRSEVFERDYRHLPALLSMTEWHALHARAMDCSEAAEMLEAGTPPVGALSADRIELAPASGPVIYALCIADCAASQHEIQASDTYFADLAASRIDSATLSPAAMAAWEIWLQLTDTAGQARHSLPWWLRATGSVRHVNVGLIDPGQAALLQRHQAELQTLLLPHAASVDTQRLFALVATAAEAGQWVLGYEPAG